MCSDKEWSRQVISSLPYLLYCRYSALEPVWAETRPQSGDWYGSGTLHPGQDLVVSLLLLSPVLGPSHFRQNARNPSGGRWKCGRECCLVILPKWRLPRHLGIFYMPQIYDIGPTALLPLRRIFSPLKIRRLRQGLNPRTWVLKASTLSLDHRSRFTILNTIKIDVLTFSRWIFT